MLLYILENGDSYKYWGFPQINTVKTLAHISFGWLWTQVFNAVTLLWYLQWEKAKFFCFFLSFIPPGHLWVRHCCFCRSVCPWPLVTQSLSLVLSQWVLKNLKLNKCLAFIWLNQLPSLNKHQSLSQAK